MKKASLSAMAVAVSMALAPGASSAGVIGFLGNFDVINDTGSTAHGFEIELEGLHSYEITDTFGGAGRGFPSGRGFDPLTSVQRYGAPTITECFLHSSLRAASQHRLRPMPPTRFPAFSVLTNSAPAPSVFICPMVTVASTGEIAGTT